MKTDLRPHPKLATEKPFQLSAQPIFLCLSAMWQVLKKSSFLPALLGSLIHAAALAAAPSAEARKESPPPIQREFRALWVATYQNIDWPSQPGLDSARQKQELLEILDRAAALHFNVIIFQVRDCCDAFYESKNEPWSEYLTGRMGQAPSPLYDPLQFAVTEAHKRGMQLHAWFNPYRARLRNPKTAASPGHVTFKHPELIRSYGKYLWLDPAEQGTRDYSLNVVMDVVHRYDIDGVQFDDYFYPYPEIANGQEINFPDGVPWEHYLTEGGKMSRADWRRENVNRFVRAVYQFIKQEKPWVQFGISPFGIWRPHYPPQITGFDAYNGLYCDARKWMQEGWLDYCAPQLYWPVDQKAQSFPVLLQWWAAENTRHRTLLAGMKVDGWRGVADDAREELREIEAVRRQSEASGEILWHSRPLLSKTSAVAEVLEHTLYAAPALVPASPWLSETMPEKPSLRAAASEGELKLEWHPAREAVAQWILQTKMAGHWDTEMLPSGKTNAWIKPGPTRSLPEAAVLFALDRFGHLSEGAEYVKAPRKPEP